MLEDAWFPFAPLLGEGMKDLQTYYEIYYEEGEEHSSIIEKLISFFDKVRLTDNYISLAGNPLFNSKKILQAGSNSYLTNTKERYINSGFEVIRCCVLPLGI